jgi:hypothetical protein
VSFLGEAGQERLVIAGYGLTGQRVVSAGYDEAGTGWYGSLRLGVARSGRRGTTRHGGTCRGEVMRVQAGMVVLGTVARVAQWLGWLRQA